MARDRQESHSGGLGPGVTWYLPGGFQVARDRQESDSGGLGSPGTCKEVSRWPGIARSRIVGAWCHLVSPRRFLGGQGWPGVG